MTIDVKQSVATGVRPGLRLKKARETQNYTLDDVAKHIKTHKKIIEALEKEDLQNLPQSIYVTGYLKSYANLVSLPVSDILDNYPNLHVADPVLPKFKTEANSARFGNSGVLIKEKTKNNLLIVAVLLVAVAVGGWFFYKSNRSLDVTSGLFSSESSQSENALSSFLSDTTDENASRETSDADGSGVGVQIKDLETQIQEEIAQEMKQDEQELSAAVADVLGVSSRLLLEFTKDSWVEVEDAKGEKLLYRLVKAPARRVVDGQAPFKVFLGNASGVLLNYNGLPFDISSYIDGDVAQLSIGKADDNTQKKNLKKNQKKLQ